MLEPAPRLRLASERRQRDRGAGNRGDGVILRLGLIDHGLERIMGIVYVGNPEHHGDPGMRLERWTVDPQLSRAVRAHVII